MPKSAIANTPQLTFSAGTLMLAGGERSLVQRLFPSGAVGLG
ncbi:MAG: hypothetical protein R3C99_13920 [Pirellulaceae bacterium]